ncbi:MAG: protocatechuate 3,4-dioxygenase subunit alpha [Pseudomonadota bacterium]
MVHQPGLLPETASQTAGPYVHIGLMPSVAGIDGNVREIGGDIAGPEAAGERIRVEGMIRDGQNMPVCDAVIEVCQANADGIFVGAGQVEPGFAGWARVATDFDTGLWQLNTVKPGAVGHQAPHLALWVVARGINVGLHTRVYFDDEDTANATCPVLTCVPDARRGTLIARRSGGAYRFDIRLQGDDETVFFDL